MSAHRLTLAAALAASTVVTGCDLAPHYQVPDMGKLTDGYRETGPWTQAAPADTASRGHWWSVIQDPELDALETRLDHDSPSLTAALARYDQAVDLFKQARAGLFPEIDASAEASHVITPPVPQYVEHDLGTGASLGYEIDLWGQVRNQVRAAKDEAQASDADAASVKLSLEAQLAEDYLNLRGLDAQIDVLRKTTDAYKQALDLTRQRSDGGASNELDLDRAKTQLGDVQSQYEQAVASRSLLEHAIAALVGESASSFTLPSDSTLASVPHVPVDTPSALLQRRPDIAAAERRVAEANANIGVYRAAMYPNVTLSGGGGFETVRSWANAAAGYWAIGPAMAVMPVFDAGRRRAGVARARSAFDAAAATYRQTVLDAFRQVEDQLALCNRLARAEEREQEAVDAAVQTDKLATTRYVEGASDYLEVVIAQTAELQTRRADLMLHTQRLVSSVDLVRALGGGWSANQIPAKPKVTARAAD
jgi:NodT family efflux transporter outer membrane factor (OMF) lipoprotein